MKKLIFLSSLFLTLFSSVAISQVTKPNEMYFGRDSLRSDLRELKRVIYESHQDPFVYIDSTEFEEIFEETLYSIEEGMSLTNFAEVVSDLLQTLKDSHTGVDFGYLFSFLYHKKSLNLNFKTEFIENKIIITNDLQDIIPAGSELLSINGISMEKLLIDVEAYKFQEGDSNYSRDHIIGAIVTRIYSVSYPVKEENLIEYSFKGGIKKSDYPGIPYKKISKQRKKLEKSPFQLDIEDGVAFLKIGSFSSESDGKYSAFLDKSFKKIKRQNCQKLVIDLRGNFGGSVWRMEQLFTYLEGPDVMAPANMIMTKSELSSHRYNYLTRGLRGWMRMNMYQKNEKMKIFRQLAKLPMGETDTVYYETYPEKKKFAFSGDMSLFINHSSASASVLFASCFARNNFGKIYGTPCLGPSTGTWGNPTPYRLKETGLRLNIAVIRLNATNEFNVETKSIQPDVFYEPSIEDVIEGKDGLRELFLKPAS